MSNLNNNYKNTVINYQDNNYYNIYDTGNNKSEKLNTNQSLTNKSNYVNVTLKSNLNSYQNKQHK